MAAIESIKDQAEVVQSRRAFERLSHALADAIDHLDDDSDPDAAALSALRDAQDVVEGLIHS